MNLQKMINAYNASAPLAEAATIPSAWYTDSRIYTLECRTVFSRNWIALGRVDQLVEPGQYLTAELAGEPLLVVRDGNGRLGAFYNVCRHHAAAVMTERQGRTSTLRCPYHGWTYALDGSLKGAPEFDGVCNFQRKDHGLIPVCVDTWKNYAFVRLADSGPDLGSYVEELNRIAEPLDLASLDFAERRIYDLNCNWKVFVDNYLDGSYHVPHIHKSLSSVIRYKDYRIENFRNVCLQTAPLRSGGDRTTAEVRQGDIGYYIWLYPNFMLNWYEGVMDVNLVFPLGEKRTRVLFDFYFPKAQNPDASRRRQSVDVGERVQQEDIAVCESVQRGLRSQAYDVGRLSVRREAGEHLFHRLVHADLIAAIGQPHDGIHRRQHPAGGGDLPS